jgi:hypothetical protein
MSTNATGPQEPHDRRIDADHLVRRREPARQGGRRYWICAECERWPGAFARADVPHADGCEHR